MYLKSYKELIVWQKSIELVKQIYLLTSSFPNSEMYGLALQMRRAAISISSNIAEGYGRNSIKQYSQFYTIAYGSALELETQLIISKELEYISQKLFKQNNALVEEITKMLRSMIFKLNEKTRR